jgi:hypothetical protein
MYCNMDIEGSKSPYIKVEKERKAQFHKIKSGTRRKFLKNTKFLMTTRTITKLYETNVKKSTKQFLLIYYRISTAHLYVSF